MGYKFVNMDSELYLESFCDYYFSNKKMENLCH